LKEQAIQALDSASYQPGTDFKQDELQARRARRRGKRSLPEVGP
jgi:hypothetical protein